MELKPCPFCGGEAKIKDAMAYLDEAVQAYCTVCHTRQPQVLIDHPKIKPNANGEPMLIEETRYTREQAIKVAAAKWNRRATDDKTE